MNPAGGGLPITIRDADVPAELDEIRALFLEYAGSIGIDLEFQGFAGELANLPGAYARPGGCLLFAVDDGHPVGCVAVRRLAPAISEMKRLYVRPAVRGQGVGRLLAEAAVSFGRSAGYGAMRLDTLSSMEAARALYRRLGFLEVAPYRFNPLTGAVFMELAL